CIHIPAAMRSVLAVGALNQEGLPWDRGNWGAPYHTNGLLAPGDKILTAVPGSDIKAASGTSFATAVVSSVAALLLSVAQKEQYKLDPIDIQEILPKSAMVC